MQKKVVVQIASTFFLDCRVIAIFVVGNRKATALTLRPTPVVWRVGQSVGLSLWP
jgi:hypothetical protein